METVNLTKIKEVGSRLISSNWEQKAHVPNETVFQADDLCRAFIERPLLSAERVEL